MTSIHELKQRETLETPLLLFECQLPGGSWERWSTHAVSFEGKAFEARVSRHNLLEMKSAADDGIDAFSKLTLTLANADSYFSQVARSFGWKGAKLTAKFVFFNLRQGEPATEAQVVFRGVCNPPDEITESSIRLTFSSRMNLQRILMPQVRIQRRCPWMFPATRTHRELATSAVMYSPFARCGYSADVPTGLGTLDGTQPFSTCDYTRSQCIERGMFDRDAEGRETRRFGGIEFVPSSTLVKTYGEKATHLSATVENETKFNDFVPVIYGTAWYRPPVIFAKNDGNLTHMEVLLGLDEIDSVLKVVVNGNELPIGSSGAPNITATGWFNVVTPGSLQGAFNLDFVDNSGIPVGDPYGSMAVLSVVVPNRISDGTPLPRVDVLAQGLKLPTFAADGGDAGKVFTNNPAWVILDLLRRSGWETGEIDLSSFASVAAYCSEPIETTDLSGTVKAIPRFQCNLVLRKRRSASDVVRAVRNGSGLFLTYGASGLLELNAESSLGIQQADRPETSNSVEQLNGGWPAYEFGDGTNDFSDIVRRDSREPAVRLWSRSTAEAPNRYTIEFQDEFNEYQQDSLSLVDFDDALQSGQEVAASLIALGIPNFNQAGRVLRLNLDKSIRGNVFLDFETGPRGIGLKPGDLITFTYFKDGFDRQPFRILRVAPGPNYRTISVTAQIHDDLWYTSGGGTTGLIGGGRQPASQVGVPRPLAGSVIAQNGETEFGIEARSPEGTAGDTEVELSVSFAHPQSTISAAVQVPYVSLAAQVATSGGSLAGGTTYYYGLTANDEGGRESPLSFSIRATVPEGTDTNAVTLQQMSFAPGAVSFNVYRGRAPMKMLRIATEQPISSAFVDDGKPVAALTPPDPNYHHANFYWRLEVQPETSANIVSESSIGSEQLTMNANEFRGKTVRITGGTGRAQERLIISNTETTLVVSKTWDEMPDTSSSFVIAEPGWKFGGLTPTSPITFTVPNRTNAAIHILGRAANVHDNECASEISPLTRYEIGGAGSDTDVPPTPIFGLRSVGNGLLEISSIGFETLENTRSIAAANLTIHTVDELVQGSLPSLAAPLDDAQTQIKVAPGIAVSSGTLIQIGTEVMTALSVSQDGTELEVSRAAASSQASSHEPGSLVQALRRKAFILPFSRNYFGSPASGSYTCVLSEPDLRVVAAELSMTNSKGTSQVGWVSFADTPDRGIRTLSGGQVLLQVDGTLAVQSSSIPPFTVPASHAVRDVIARTAEAPMGSEIQLMVTVNGEPWCPLSIAEGETVSNVVAGRELPPLLADSALSLDVLMTGAIVPGSGLSVSIRL